jgi:hypothetical protein
MPGQKQQAAHGTHEAELAKLQVLIDRSTASATPSVADSVAYSERQMPAAEFVEFWRSIRLVAMSTVGAGGAAPYRSRSRATGWREVWLRSGPRQRRFEFRSHHAADGGV